MVVPVPRTLTPWHFCLALSRKNCESVLFVVTTAAANVHTALSHRANVPRTCPDSRLMIGLSGAPPMLAGVTCER